VNSTLEVVNSEAIFEPSLTAPETSSLHEFEVSEEDDPTCQVDEWTYIDGHVVGHDGFVVPINFDEFYRRFPLYVKKFCRRHMPIAYHSAADREEREADLLLHLITLPVDSKFRQPGYNGHENGCTDRIQTFVPASSYGASQSRFLNFINKCLLNHFISLGKKAGANPILRYSNVSLIDEDFLHRMSNSYRNEVLHFDRQMDSSVIVDEFRNMVEEYNPELIAVLDAMTLADSFLEAQANLGLSEQMFMRSRNRLKVLYSCYTNRTTPPRQRKIYRARVPKANRLVAVTA
jgi:hypothetical protein